MKGTEDVIVLSQTCFVSLWAANSCQIWCLLQLGCGIKYIAYKLNLRRRRYGEKKGERVCWWCMLNEVSPVQAAVSPLVTPTSPATTHYILSKPPSCTTARSTNRQTHKYTSQLQHTIFSANHLRARSTNTQTHNNRNTEKRSPATAHYNHTNHFQTYDTNQ